MLTKMKQSRILIIYVAVLAVIVTITGCHHNSATDDAINEAELLIESQPDSSLAILNAIDSRSLRGDEQRARYALLMSMALDKNYIDTTSFDVLQPAIDYYLEHGTPDERLRTLYYQGCIYRNRGDDANAMASCIDALELKDVTDTLVLARVYVGQAVLYYKQYKIDEFVNNHLRAGDLYKTNGDYASAIKSFSKALNMSVLLKNKFRSDSLVAVCQELLAIRPDMLQFYNDYYLSYLIEYAPEEDIREALKSYENVYVPDDILLNVVRGYSKIKETERALSLLDDIEIGPDTSDSLKYYSIKSEVLKMAGDYAGALSAYEDYLYTSQRQLTGLFSNDLLFAEKKYDIEISNLRNIQTKDSIIKYSIIAIMVLIVSAGIIYFRYHSNKVKRIIAEQNNLNLKLENRTAELEVENLRLEKTELEYERENLRNLLNEQAEISVPIKEAINVRLNLLNGLLASEISDNESYAVPYKKWIENIRKDRQSFIESTRHAFSASNPNFIHYLESHGLSEDEIGYVCLYAIGLKGKEVGEYLQLKGHYNISSTIRKKLGIGEHDTNLGIYIKRLMNDMG